MKRAFCVLLLLCLVPLCSLADDYDDFNTYAFVVGAPRLDKSRAQYKDDSVIYLTDSGFVGFDSKSICVYGTGEQFLMYGIAGICMQEEQNLTENSGIFLTAYIRSKDGERQEMKTVGGHEMSMTMHNGNFMFIIVR